jgi:hypothetical protein
MLQVQRVRDYFDGPNGKDRYLALVAFAHRTIQSMRWCIATSDDSIPGGRKADDIVNEALKSVLLADRSAEGRRQIPDAVELGHGLRTIVLSILNHAAEGFENRHRVDPVAVGADGEEQDLLDTSVPFWDPSNANLTPEELVAASSRCVRFIEFSKRDKIVCAMLMLIRDEGIDRPAELIAKRLSIKVMDVFAARKRLATLVRKFGANATP